MLTQKWIAEYYTNKVLLYWSMNYCFYI